MMRLLDRLVVLLASLLLVLLGLTVVVSTVGWDPFGAVNSTLQFIATHRVWSGLIGIFLVLAGWHLIFRVVVPQREEETVVRDTALGQVRIQHRALENLAIRSTHNIEGVKDVEARIQPFREGVEVRVLLNVLAGYHINDVSDQVQATVEEAVRDAAGVAVENVTVEIKNVMNHGKGARARAD